MVLSFKTRKHKAYQSMNFSQAVIGQKTSDHFYGVSCEQTTGTKNITSTMRDSRIWSEIKSFISENMA